MEMKRCYSCMKLTAEAVCPHCGNPLEGNNPPNQLSVGTVLAGRYLVGRFQSQSASQIVYLALDQWEDKTVLIRECFPRGVRREGLDVAFSDAYGETQLAVGIEEFIREGEALTGIGALNVATGTRELIREHNTVYIVSDHVRGPSLSRFVKMRGGSLGAEETFRLMTPVLQAMGMLHQAKLVHGQISMENIVLDPMGGARLIGFSGNRAVNVSDDVFALSRVLCGCLVPEGDLQTVNLEEIPGLTGRQRSALQMGLSPDPHQRFASAAAMVMALLGPDAMKKAAQIPVPERPAAHPPVSRPSAPEAPAQSPAAKQEKPVSMATEIISDFKVEQRFREAQQNAAAAAAGPQPAETPAAAPAEEKVPLGGSPAPEPSQTPSPEPEPAGPRKSKKGLIAVLVSLLVLLALGGAGTAGYFLYHVWEPATCDGPAFCRICGITEGEPLEHDWQEATCHAPQTCALCARTRGEPLEHVWDNGNCVTPKTCTLCGDTTGDPLENGHNWENATCTQPKTCTYCGQTKGDSLGHKWIKATYTQPKTCDRCGATEGSVKGYQESASGKWEKFRRGSSNTYAFVFDQPLIQCKAFTVNFTPTFEDGNRVEEWSLIYQDEEGTWIPYQTFTLTADTTSVAFEFSPFKNIYAVAVVPAESGNYLYSFSMTVTDIYVRG